MIASPPPDDRARVGPLGQERVVDHERAGADRLGQVRVHLAVREHGPPDVAAAVEAQQRRRIVGDPVRELPQCWNAPGINLQIVDPTGFSSQDVPEADLYALSTRRRRPIHDLDSARLCRPVDLTDVSGREPPPVYPRS